jgi:hypothetical protein
MLNKSIMLLVISLLMPLLYIKSNALQQIEATLNAFLDTYLSTDNDFLPNGSSSERKYSFSNHKKDQFSINLATIGLNIIYKEKVRSTISFQMGDLQMTSLPTGIISPFIQQANVGFQLFHNIWIDGGYFLSQLRSEGLILKDNWLSTYNLLSFFEPFYHAGLKLSYKSDAVILCFHVLNGSGIIKENNVNKTFGFDLSMPFSKDINLSYSGIYGNEEEGNPIYSKFHHLHTINFIAQLEKIGFKVQFDYAGKEKIKNANKDNGILWGTAFTTRYCINNKYSSTVRVSFINNADLVEGYASVSGLDFTLGAEYKPIENTYIRVEGRYIQLDNELYKYFLDSKGNKKNNRTEINLNMGIWLDY